MTASTMAGESIAGCEITCAGTSGIQGSCLARAARLIQGFAFGMFMCMGGNLNAAEITQEFHIDNGLFKPPLTPQADANRKMYSVSPPDYAGAVRDSFGVNGYPAERRIEFRRHYIDGQGESWPTLWEPDAFCETLLTKPEPVAGQPHSWRLTATTSGTPLPDTACNQLGRLGGVFGITHAIVAVTPSAEGIRYTLAVFSHGSDQPLAQGSLQQAQTVREIPSRALFNEHQFDTLQTLAAYPALITAEVTDRHGAVHPLTLHRIRFKDHTLPVLNVYDHFSGCVFARRGPGPGAENAPGFTLEDPIDAPTIQHQCDEKKALKSYLVGETFSGGATELSKLGDMVFVRQPEGGYAVTIESTHLLMGNYRSEHVAQGTARLTGTEPLYVDYTPATGARNIQDYYLVTNDGLFKIGTDHAVYVHERTDLHSLFNPGDRIASLSWNQIDQEMHISWMQRTVNGQCPDTPGPAETLRFTPTSAGVWSGKSAPGSSSERACFAQEINLTTCELIRCVQWTDSMSWDNAETYLTSSESEARRLWQSVYKWTRANTGSMYDPATYKAETTTDNDGYDPWCGLEGCEAKRRREQLEDTLIDLWNQ